MDKTTSCGWDFEPSVLSSLLQDHQLASDLPTTDQDKELKELAFVLFVGGTDTQLLLSALLQQCSSIRGPGQGSAEIDSVLGYATRLPTMADEAQLPYVRNLILEVLRWQPVTPTGGAPHVCYQDDVYRGYNIQKGTIVFANAWSLSRDEAVYQNAESFEPDRFLDSNVPPLPAFGWGRRKCPGMHFAEASLFLGISSMLLPLPSPARGAWMGRKSYPQLRVLLTVLLWCSGPLSLNSTQGLKSIVNLSSKICQRHRNSVQSRDQAHSLLELK
ncbi:cytochrome P450 [Rhizoctonia solani]|nr:cytochrome P450 [Rhizoctonia solani]